jgi:hypothetical protein
MISSNHLFFHHPPKTESRKWAHRVINADVLKLAIKIENLVVDSDCKKQSLLLLKQCQVLANQGIVNDELSGKMFEETEWSNVLQDILNE